MGVPISKTRSLSNRGSMKEEQDINWKFKVFATGSIEINTNSNAIPPGVNSNYPIITHTQENQQPILSNPNNTPLIQDVGLFLITEEENDCENLIHQPQNIPITSYDKSNINNNELQDLKKKIQTLEFNQQGAFSRVDRRPLESKQIEPFNLFCSKTIYLTQHLIINNKIKALNALKGIFPKIKGFFNVECKIGSLFIGQEKQSDGLRAYLFQENHQFKIFEEKPLEALKDVLKLLNLEHFIQNPKIMKNFMKGISISFLQSLRKEPNISNGFFKVLWQFNIADYGIQSLIRKNKNERQSLSFCFIKSLFKDVSSSIALLTLKGIKIAKVQFSNIFYIENIDIFFLWFPNFSLNNNVSPLNTEEYSINLSTINILNTIPQDNNQSLFEIIDFGPMHKRNITSESFVMSENPENSFFGVNDKEMKHFFEDESIIEKNFNLFNKDHFNALPQKNMNDDGFNQIIEFLGYFLKRIMELVELEKQNTFGFMNLMNEETYFSFFNNYYVGLSNLETHKSRNFFHFFLDKNLSKRIDLIGLLHYFDHEVLTPWKYLEISQLSFTLLTSKTGNFQYSNGFQYEGEFRTYKDKKILHGKGVLKQVDTGEIIYEGYWKQSQFHGKGILNLFGADLYVYKGEFRYGRCHGEGMLSYKNKIIYKGSFSNNNYYKYLIESSPILNDIIDDNFGCYVSFEDPIKGISMGDDANMNEIQNNCLNKITDFMGIIYEENEIFETVEVNLIGLKPKETRINKACEWIIKKVKVAKQFIIVHCLKDEEIWVIDGFDVTTLRAKLRIYVSERPLVYKRLILILKYLKGIFEDFAIKLWQPLQEIDHSDIEGFIEELSLKLFSLFKLKKLDILEKTLLGVGSKGQEICEKLFNSFLIHKLKRLDIKRSNLTDEFFEVLKKSPYLSSLDDIIMKKCRLITDLGYMYLSEIPTLNSLRRLSLIRTSITNKGLMYILRAEFAETLEKLNLSESFLLNDDGFIDFFKKNTMKSLQKLYLSWNRLSDASLRVLFESQLFPNLKKLKLIKCPVFDKLSYGETSSSYLKNLCKIDLSKTLISKPNLMILLRRFPNLKILRLSYCHRLNALDLKLIMAMSELKQLKKLDIRGIHLFPSHLEYLLKNTPKLTNLNLKFNPLIINETVCEILKTSPQILVINFSNTTISDESFEEFHKISRVSELRNLFLKNTKISDRTITILFEKGIFPQLRVLDVSYTEISDFGIETMASNLLVAKLYDLNLKGCQKVSDKGIEYLLHYFPNSYLKKLDLSNLNISEKILTHKNFFYLKATIKLIMKGCPIGKKELKQALLQRLNRKKEDFDFQRQNICPSFQHPHVIEDLFVKELEKGIIIDQIQNLDFSNNQIISDKIIETMFSSISFYNLQELNLEGCEISDQSISSISASKTVKNLLKIILNKTGITDKGLFQISVSWNFKKLSRLEVVDCSNISDSGTLDILRSLIIQIEYLDVSSTRITDLTLDGIIQGKDSGIMINLKEIWVYFCTGICQEKVNDVNKNYNLFCYY